MKAELRLHPKGFYEVWGDDRFLRAIPQGKNEKKEDYKKRAEAEFDEYVEGAKQIKKHGGAASKEVKSVDI